MSNRNILSEEIVTGMFNKMKTKGRFPQILENVDYSFSIGIAELV
jgi:hypothetical protein